MFRLTNPVRGYEWGSRTQIPRLLGVPGDGTAWAELWLGAHPAAPSHVPDGRSLREAIRAAPETMLGESIAARFDDQLPFLMKLLAAAEPLSLQVHPNPVQAQQGYAAENAAGIGLDAPDRNYRDRSAKPELVFALTRFEGMAGWRDPDASAEILRRFEVPFLDSVADQLGMPGPKSVVLAEVVAELLALPADEVPGLVGDVTAAAVAADARPHPISLRSRPPVVSRDAIERESLRVFAQTAQLAGAIPGTRECWSPCC